jgi:hypothetical protein
MRWYWFALALVLVTGSLACAHDSEEWIKDKDIRNDSGGQCCGPKDCVRMDEHEFTEVKGGWWVREYGEDKSEFISWNRALPVSEDGDYHRCGPMSRDDKIIGDNKWHRTTSCWIVPPRGM